MGPLDAWHRIAKAHSWKNLVEIQAVLPYTEAVGEFTVFNIKGNAYRLITWVKYARELDDGAHKDGTIFIREVLTHADYDKGKWKR